MNVQFINNSVLYLLSKSIKTSYWPLVAPDHRWTVDAFKNIKSRTIPIVILVFPRGTRETSFA